MGVQGTKQQRAELKEVKAAASMEDRGENQEISSGGGWFCFHRFYQALRQKQIGEQKGPPLGGATSVPELHIFNSELDGKKPDCPKKAPKPPPKTTQPRIVLLEDQAPGSSLAGSGVCSRPTEAEGQQLSGGLNSSSTTSKHDHKETRGEKNEW